MMHIGYTIVDMSVGFVGLCANSFALFVFLTNKELRKTKNYHIISLTVVDIIVALLSSPSTVLTDGDFGLTYATCLLLATSVKFFYGAAEMYHLLAISVLRFLRILNPAANSDDSAHVKRFVTVSLAVSWTMPLVYSVLPLTAPGLSLSHTVTCSYHEVVDYRWSVFLLFGVITPNLFIMAILYGCIYIYVRKRNSHEDDDVTFDMLRRESEEMAAVRFYLLLVVYSAICWIPLTVDFGLITLRVNKYGSREDGRYVLVILAHANSAGNPFLYAYAHADFKKVLSRLYRIHIRGATLTETWTQRSYASNAMRVPSPVQ